MIRYVLSVFSCLLLAGCMSQPPAPMVNRSERPQSVRQPSGPDYYTVKRGDTLYHIAVEHGVDYNQLAAWNNIVDPASITEGQVLRVVPPAAAGASGNAVVNPIASGAAVEARPLGQETAGPESVTVKREPRVGKEPYSDEAYNRLNKTGEAPAKPAQASAEAKPATAAAEPKPAAGDASDDTPWIYPSSGKVLAKFSDSNKGIDFGGKSGDPIVAAGDGKVVYAGSGLRGYGELVIVKHNATFLSAYAHNSKILVKEGQQVHQGQKIAEMGKTDADSVRLHFEIRKQGKPVDPSLYLPKR